MLSMDWQLYRYKGKNCDRIPLENNTKYNFVYIEHSIVFCVSLGLFHLLQIILKLKFTL
jgi:hypothetical protein